MDSRHNHTLPSGYISTTAWLNRRILPVRTIRAEGETHLRTSSAQHWLHPPHHYPVDHPSHHPHTWTPRSRLQIPSRTTVDDYPLAQGEHIVRGPLGYEFPASGIIPVIPPPLFGSSQLREIGHAESQDYLLQNSQYLDRHHLQPFATSSFIVEPSGDSNQDYGLEDNSETPAMDRKRGLGAEHESAEAKRQRQSGTSQAVDLSEDTETRNQQMADAVRQQADDDAAPKSFADMTCIICMDNFTDLTATPCGHIFCHECLTQALAASERNSSQHGSCPVCRKTLRRTTKNHVIPLSFMTKSQFSKNQARTQGRMGL